MESWLEYFKRKPRRVLFHGASVTVQKDGFRSALMKIICEESAHVHIELINGVGGVGSLFGNCNLDTLGILPCDVDVVFHEFFTGDTNSGITPENLIRPLLESFLLRYAGKPVVFVLNYRKDRTSEYLSHIGLIYQQIAEKYGVPCIHVYEKVANASVEGQSLDIMFRDGVHPTPRGATFIAGEIWRQLRDSLVARVSPPTVSLQDRSLVDLRLLNVAEILSLATFEEDPNVGVLDYQNTGQKFSYLNVSSKLKIDFSPYKVMGFLSVIGPLSPLFISAVDSLRGRKFRTFDRNCFYFRPQTYAWEMCAAGSFVEIHVESDPPDFSICPRHHEGFDLPRVFMLSGFYVKNRSG
jgi:hypothetical protein